MMAETVGQGMIAGLGGGAAADKEEEMLLIRKRTNARMEKQRAAKEAAHEAAIFGGAGSGATAAASGGAGSFGGGRFGDAGGRVKHQENGSQEDGFAGLRSGVDQVEQAWIGAAAEGGGGASVGVEVVSVSRTAGTQGVAVEPQVGGMQGRVDGNGLGAASSVGLGGLADSLVVQQQKGLSWRERVATMKGAKGSS